MLSTFLFGAAAYPALEILWRGRTHPSMALAGGASMLLIRRISRIRAGLPLRAILSGIGITAVEYACGKAFNRDYRVWDYRKTPLNWQGQICLPYTLMWCGLSAGVLSAMDVLRRNAKKPGS